MIKIKEGKMRDDRIISLIKKENSHIATMSILESEQIKIAIESIKDVIMERGSMIKTFFSPQWFNKRFNHKYTEKAKEFNEKLKSMITQEKLKI